MKSYLPGLSLTALLAVLALILGSYFPIVGTSVFAILLGILFRVISGNHPSLSLGIAYSAKKLLQYAIIMLGFSMSIGAVSQTGLASLRITLITIGVAFLVAAIAGHLFKLSGPLNTLIGFGTAICGGSAIAAASPIVEAEDDDIALAMSTIFLFNIIGVFLFPFLGHIMQMGDQSFGLWAGTAINDTSSVVAAGYSYSQEAGDYATVVKLARALMIVPACLIMAGVKSYRSKRQSGNFQFKRVFPWFILWFFVASVLSSLGLFPKEGVTYTKYLSQFLMAMALSGIGCQVSFAKIKQAGWGPLLTGALTWAAVAISSLILQILFYGLLTA